MQEVVFVLILDLSRVCSHSALLDDSKIVFANVTSMQFTTAVATCLGVN